MYGSKMGRMEVDSFDIIVQGSIEKKTLSKLLPETRACAMKACLGLEAEIWSLLVRCLLLLLLLLLFLLLLLGEVVPFIQIYVRNRLTGGH